MCSLVKKTKINDGLNWKNPSLQILIKQSVNFRKLIELNQGSTKVDGHLLRNRKGCDHRTRPKKSGYQRSVTVQIQEILEAYTPKNQQCMYQKGEREGSDLKKLRRKQRGFGGFRVDAKGGKSGRLGVG